MTSNTRRLGVVALVAVAIAAAVFWSLDARTRPERVGARFAAELREKHPGTALQRLDGDTVRIALPSGTNVEVRMGDLFDACHASRWRCGGLVDDAVAEVDRSDAATRDPKRDRLRPIVVGEPGGYRYGYVADPLIGPFEVRYALVDGFASTFATDAIVDRLGLSRDALRAQAVATVRADHDAKLERQDDSPVYRVRSTGDPAASLLDRERMSRFATDIGVRRLYADIPVRNTLLLAPADEAGAVALEGAASRLRGSDPRTFDGGVLAYDIDAPDGQALSIPHRSSALRQP